MRNSDTPPVLDAVVIGGGPAGLQASLTLGRMRYDTVLFDSGRYRNETVAHAHNLITNDGRAPGDLRASARDELARYDTVALRDDEVVAITRRAGGFAVTSAGGAVSQARALVLATGMRDELPPIPGLAEAWGREVAQCPFCHGHELTGRPVGILGVEPHAGFMRGMLERIASRLIVIAPDDLARVEPVPAGLRLHLGDDTSHDVGGLFVAATPRQAAPFAEELGCRILPSGGVEVDALGRTSVPGVYAGGDLAHVASLPGPMVSIAAAIASGQLAAASVVRDAAGALIVATPR